MPLLAAALALVALAVPAAEGERAARLAIVARFDVQPSGDLEDAAGAILDQILRVAQFVLGVQVVPATELGASRLEQHIRECGSSIGCIAERARATDIELLLLVTFDTSFRPLLSTWELVDTGSGKVIANAVVQIEAGKDLAPAISAEAAKLMRAAGRQIGARVIVETSPADARIALDPAAERTKGNVLLVREGSYIVRATRDGYAESVLRTRIGALEEQKLNLILEPTPSIVESPWFWTGVGVAVAASVAIVAALVVRSSPQPVILCQMHPASTCPP